MERAESAQVAGTGAIPKSPHRHRIVRIGFRRPNGYLARILSAVVGVAVFVVVVVVVVRPKGIWPFKPAIYY